MIDWFKIITELQKNAVSIKKMGRIIGINYQTICFWRDGVEPRYNDGKKLIELYMMVTGKCESEIPTKKIELRAGARGKVLK